MKANPTTVFIASMTVIWFIQTGRVARIYHALTG